MNAFNLQVIPLKEKYSDSQELSIEQYFILHPEFNLNTLKVVNSISGSPRSKSLFMYSKDLTKLIYSSDVQEDFIFKLKIHHSIFSRSIKTGEGGARGSAALRACRPLVYLGKYVFLDQPVLGATECNSVLPFSIWIKRINNSIKTSELNNTVIKRSENISKGNRMIARLYSTKSNSYLSPWFVTGFPGYKFYSLVQSRDLFLAGCAGRYYSISSSSSSPWPCEKYYENPNKEKKQILL